MSKKSKQPFKASRLQFTEEERAGPVLFCGGTPAYLYSKAVDEFIGDTWYNLLIRFTLLYKFDGGQI